MPTPINPNNTFPGATPSGTITWNGPSIDCLDICPGMSLNKITYIIASKVCALVSPYDLSTLTLQGALDIFNTTEPQTRTIANIFQLCLDNEVGLKQLIDNLQDQIDGISGENFVVNLRCLAVTDAFGNSQPYTRDGVIQTLVNEVCTLVNDFEGLSDRVSVVEGQINDLLNTPAVIRENNITTCIATNKPVSQSVVLLSGDYCNYKNIVGQNTQIQSALALLPADLQTLLKNETGWVTMPASMAQGLSDVMIVLKNLNSRISVIENTCCKTTCDDVKVGYEVLLSEDGKFVSFKFSSAAGTSIPDGYEDEGSTAIITDSVGNSLSYNIAIEQDTTTDSFSIVGLDTSKPLIVEMTARLGTCTKCVPTRSITPTSSCPVCQITTGISKTNFGSATIIYKDGDSYQTINIASGGSAYLPSTATVVGIDNPNNLVLSSECIDLDNVPQFGCYVILSVLQNDTGDAHTEPWQAGNLAYKGIYVNGFRYMFPTQVTWEDSPAKLPAAIQALPNVGILFKSFVFSTPGDPNYGTKMYIMFKTIAEVADTLELITTTAVHIAGTAGLEYRLPAYDRSTFVSLGNSDVPECPTGSDV